MVESKFRLQYRPCLELLSARIEEKAPALIQLLAGPRQVGKTTLLLELQQKLGTVALYVAGDSPEGSLPGFWERLWTQAEQIARDNGRAIVLLDEVQHIRNWPGLIKGVWDRFRRFAVPVNIVASGSSALHLAAGASDSLAGRFERITLAHWTAESLASAFGLDPRAAAELTVQFGSYPGAFRLIEDPARWLAYLRDSIVEPAIGRDILALEQVRRPALLRQTFALATSMPARIVSLQKLQGQLSDRGALETLAHYLLLLEEAFLVSPLEKFSEAPIRRRAAPPKLVTLNNALLAAADPRAFPDRKGDPSRYGAWVENACLAYLLNVGHRVTYWREEPVEVDAITELGGQRWAVEVKTAALAPHDLRGLLEFTRRYPDCRPLVLCEPQDQGVALRAGVAALDWREFLIRGPENATHPAG